MRVVDAHCRPSPLSAWMRTPAALNEAQGGAWEHGRLGGEVAVRCEKTQTLERLRPQRGVPESSLDGWDCCSRGLCDDA